MGFFVIGEEEIVSGFSLIGIEGAVISSSEEAEEAFKKATAMADVTVLILTESAQSLVQEKVDDWQLKGKYPLIVVIPGLEGHLEGRKTLVDSIREAIGISI